jgi:hypothetical protein
MDRELSRKNIRLGLILFAIAAAIIAGSIAVAEIYIVLAD